MKKIAACCCYTKYIVHMYIKHTVCLMFMAGLGKESGFYVCLIHVSFECPFFPLRKKVKSSYMFPLVKSNHTNEDFFF